MPVRLPSLISSELDVLTRFTRVHFRAADIADLVTVTLGGCVLARVIEAAEPISFAW